MKITLLLILVILSCCAVAQESIRIHFLYGSKPAKGFKGSEPKLFGGLKGGHVNIEAGGRILDFMPGDCPLFPHNKKPTGGFRISRRIYWDTASSKWMTILVPITPSQMQKLQQVFDDWSQHTPYDYAVFGMRCAAATYDVLSQIGLLKEIRDRKSVVKNFYPKLLRKKLLKWASGNQYQVTFHEGTNRRKWESDKGWF